LLKPFLAAGIACGASLAQADTTSTLTGLGATNEEVPASHGSNSEVTLNWDTNWDQYADWDGRGDVYQVDQPVVTLGLAPTANTIKIGLSQFYLDEWAGGGDTSARWSVTGSVSGSLASGTWNSFNTANDPNDQGGRSVVAVNTFGQAGESLTLTVDHTATGSVSYLAMDNLTFSTMVVPEPTTAALTWAGVSGLGAIAMRRRKSQR
jgi:hypothetical protein